MNAPARPLTTDRYPGRDVMARIPWAVRKRVEAAQAVLLAELELERPHRTAERVIADTIDDPVPTTSDTLLRIEVRRAHRLPADADPRDVRAAAALILALLPAEHGPVVASRRAVLDEIGDYR